MRHANHLFSGERLTISIFPRNLRLWRKNKSLIYNLLPARNPAYSAGLSYTLGMGGIAVFATLLTIVTGGLLMFYYEPTLSGAYNSLVFIDSVVHGGRFIRALHYWAAQVMVVALIIHMARIVFTAGYRPPRDVNWFIGLGLLVICLLWNFSGYVLRYDAASIWALLVGTNLLKEVPVIGADLYLLVVGDRALGSATILRFYTWHVFALALPGLAGIGYHLWRVRVDGGLSRPDWTAKKSGHTVSRETILFRELITALVLTSGLILLSIFGPPALGQPADLNQAGLQAVQAPWFFLAIQWLLRYLPPLWAGWLIPLAGLAFLAALPLLDRRGPGRGRWFARERRFPQIAFGALLVVIVGLSLLELLQSGSP
jgi:quinol-cytochrome oxidoreductase complex cytochrome b subunit